MEMDWNKMKVLIIKVLKMIQMSISMPIGHIVEI